jgi:hypothetical protein
VAGKIPKVRPSHNLAVFDDLYNLKRIPSCSGRFMEACLASQEISQVIERHDRSITRANITDTGEESPNERHQSGSRADSK